MYVGVGVTVMIRSKNTAGAPGTDPNPFYVFQVSGCGGCERWMPPTAGAGGGQRDKTDTQQETTDNITQLTEKE